MKKSRIFMATGAFALAIGAVFATKASKKFSAGLTTGVCAIGSKDFYVQGVTKYFTVSHGGNLLTAEFAMYTSGGTSFLFPLKTAVSGTVPIRIVP